MFDREIPLPYSTIPTRFGKFDYQDPDPKDVNLADVVNALIRVSRFAGHLPHPRMRYSVLDHSVLVRELLVWAFPTAGPELRLGALLHDAAEAYLGDVTTPMKRAMGGPWRRFENRVERAVFQGLGIPMDLVKSFEVKATDLLAYQVERRDLFGWTDIRFAPEPPRLEDLIRPHSTMDLFLTRLQSDSLNAGRADLHQQAIEVQRRMSASVACSPHDPQP